MKGYLFTQFLKSLKTDQKEEFSNYSLNRQKDWYISYLESILDFTESTKFAEWLYENRWRDYIDGYWHYSFENTADMDKIDENNIKDYIKTTEQLLLIYKENK